MDTTLLIGVAGAGTILLAFVLNQTGVWKRDSLMYDAINALGAALLVAYAYALTSYPFLILNTVWFLVSAKDTWAHLQSKRLNNAGR